MKNFILICVMLLTFSCFGNNVSESMNGVEIPPEIPFYLTEPLAKANYLATHYWNQFDFTDTLLIHQGYLLEDDFVNYVDILFHADKKTANTSIKEMLSKTETEKTGRMRAHFLDLFKKYLYDPNSPFLNEDVYISVLEYIIQSKRSDEAEKSRAVFNLEMALKNRVNDPATDIEYTLATGMTGTLYAIQSDYTIILFYNPGCHACGEIISYLKDSPVVNKWLNSKRLQLLAFFPNEDLELWRKHLADVPSAWINAYDGQRTVLQKKLYDLKAIPTLYLLNKEKIVLKKDVDVRALESYLEQEKF
jgi:hypothetical protein